MSENRQFYNASNNKDVEEMQRLYATGKVDIEKTHRDNEWTALHRATKSRGVEAVEYLLSLGADPDARTIASQNISSLIIAAEVGSVKIANSLIGALENKYTDNPLALYNSLTFKGGHNDRTPTSSAEYNGNTEISQLIKASIGKALAKLDEQDAIPVEALENTEQLLNQLASSGQTNLFTKILKAKQEQHAGNPRRLLTDLQQSGQIARTARDAGFGHLAEMIEETVSEARVEVGSVETYLDAAQNGDLETVKKYIASGKIDVDATQSSKQTALYRAAVRGHIEVVKVLLEAGANPDARTNDNYSPLSEAAYQGQSAVIPVLIKALKEHYKDEPEALYKAMTFKDGGGYSVLRNAQNGRVENLIRPEIDELRKGIGNDKIVIVGSGFSGTLQAIELLNRSSRSDNEFLEIVLVERNEEGRCGGLAYGKDTANDEYVVNIQAQRMSPFPDNPSDFADWLYDEHYDIYRRNQDAVPRRIYQEYLTDRLERAISRNTDVLLTRKTGQVVDLQESAAGAHVLLDDGEVIDAAHVVLATGHTTAVKPAFLASAEGDERVLMSQWGQKGREFIDGMNKNETVFIVGTSMSAFDEIVSLKKRGHEGKIVMMSRHGYTHPTYEENSFPRPVNFNEPEVLQEIRSVSASLNEQEVVDMFIKGIRREWFDLTRQNTYVGEQIVGNWEKYVPNAIQTLEEAGVSKAAMAKLYKDYRSLIDVNRIGVSRAIGEVVNNAIIDGQVEIWTGSIDTVQPAQDGVEVVYTMHLPDGNTVQSYETFDKVISSLGQEMDYTRVTDPLWKSLMDQGVVTPHWTNLGIDVGEFGQVINSQGEESKFITAVGTMRAGDTIVRSRGYGEKGGRGGRLGPPAFSVVALKDHFQPCANYILQQVEDTATERASAARQAKDAAKSPRIPISTLPLPRWRTQTFAIAG